MMNDDKPDAYRRLLKQKGHEVRRAREAREMSQAELAKLAKTSQQTVDRVERGAVEHSRAYPRIREALGLDKLAYDNWPFDEDEDGNPIMPPRRVKLETQAVERIERGMIPVITNSGGTLRLVDAIPRSYPYEHAQGANGVLISDGSMEPVLRIGDIVVAHPHLPAQIGDLVCFARDEVAYIRTLVDETEDSWIVQSWNPVNTREIKKATLPTLEVVVTRILRNR